MTLGEPVQDMYKGWSLQPEHDVQGLSPHMYPSDKIPLALHRIAVYLNQKKKWCKAGDRSADGGLLETEELRSKELTEGRKEPSVKLGQQGTSSHAARLSLCKFI